MGKFYVLKLLKIDGFLQILFLIRKYSTHLNELFLSNFSQISKFSPNLKSLTLERTSSNNNIPAISLSKSNDPNNNYLNLEAYKTFFNSLLSCHNLETINCNLNVYFQTY